MHPECIGNNELILNEDKTMKKMLFIVILCCSFNAVADCPPELIGRWDVKQVRMKTTDSWDSFGMIFWDFQSNGRVKMTMDAEESYTCDGDVIKIASMIPASLKILAKEPGKMEIELSEGKDGYAIVVNKAVAGAASTFKKENCNVHVFGGWHVTHTSAELDKDKLKEEMPSIFTFKPDGNADVSMGGFMNFSPAFHCEGQSIVLEKIVPAFLDIQRVSANELVWKEKGDNTYFYLAK